MLWREPASMRMRPWPRRLRLMLGGEPWTREETAALREYVDWLRGPRLLLRPLKLGLGALLGGLLLGGEPLAALGVAAVAFVVVFGAALFARQQALQHLAEAPEGVAGKQAVIAGATVLVALVVVLGTAWMTHRVTVLVVGDDLSQVVRDIDEQWWGSVNTIVVSDIEDTPAALQRDTPDILLLTGATDPVAEGIGPGTVAAHRENDPTTVVTLHLTNGDESTEDFLQELLMYPGPGQDAFRRAGFVPGGH